MRTNIAKRQRSSGLGARIRTLRERSGLSLDDVTEKTGIAKANLSNIETGSHLNPTLNTLERIASAIGCKVGDLV